MRSIINVEFERESEWLLQDKTCIEVVGIDVVVAPLRFKQKAR